MPEWKIEKPVGHRGVVVVGCGGTGGYVAEGLCRLFVDDKERDIFLIDPDIVEPPNLRRQNFFEGDVGRFKSRCLAERLARQYGRKIGWSVEPFHRNMATSLGGGLYHPLTRDLIIDCVDNAVARNSIEEAMIESYLGWWLDAGNGENSGQVLIGNARADHLEGTFRRDGTVWRLPLPTVQQPSLLMPAPEKKRQSDCAEAVEAGGQGPVINQQMAVLVLLFVHRLLGGELDWMGAYIDLERGGFTTVPATPQEVSKITGMPVRALMEKEAKR